MTALVVGLHAALAVATAALVLTDAARGRGRALAALALLLPVVGAGLVLAFVAPSDVPVNWLTPMREGGTDVQVRIARGEGAGLGLAWVHLWVPWLAPEPRSLASIVRVDGALAVAALLGLGAALAGRAGVVGLLVTLAWASSLPATTAVLGGGPAPAAWVALLPALLGLDAAWRGRWLGGLVALLGGACAALVREELLLLPIVSLGALGLHRVGAGARLAASLRARPGRWALGATALIALSVATLEPFHLATRQLDVWAFLVHVVHPLDASVLAAPPILAALFPVGLAVLLIVGVLRAPAATAGTGLAFLALLRLYHGAAHGGWLGGSSGAWPAELVRYLALVGPIVPWVAALGWQAVARRGRGPAALAVVLLVVPAQPWVWPQIVRGAIAAVPWGPYGPMDLDNQVEVRLLDEAARRFPTCGFVAPGDPPTSGARTWLAWRSGWGVPRGHDARLLLLRDVDGPEAAAEQVPGAPDCVLLLDGLSCADGSCGPWVERRDVVLHAPPGAAHAHPQHGWRDADGPRLLRVRGTPR